MSAFLAFALSSFTTSFFSLLILYVGLNSSSKSTPSPSLPRVARSRIWPLDDTTSNPSPKYFSIVFDFEGDSTITRFLCTSLLVYILRIF